MGETVGLFRAALTAHYGRVHVVGPYASKTLCGRKPIRKMGYARPGDGELCRTCDIRMRAQMIGLPSVQRDEGGRE